MGLDMYANKVKADVLSDDKDVDFQIAEGAQCDEVHYWRKHHDLHGLMHNLYLNKGGADSEFNCVNLRLRESDLDIIEHTLKSNALPNTTGFFFGNNPPDKESNDADLEFVAMCRKEIADGNAIIYSAWY